MGVSFLEVDIIPFTSKLPEFNRNRSTIFYVSTTFNSLAFEDIDLRKGLFFYETAFSLENCIEKWGHHMLNQEATVTTFKELIADRSFMPDKLLFIRPNDDSKSFAVEVRRFGEIGDWCEKIDAVENTDLSSESKIVV